MRYYVKKLQKEYVMRPCVRERVCVCVCVCKDCVHKDEGFAGRREKR